MKGLAGSVATIDTTAKILKRANQTLTFAFS